MNLLLTGRRLAQLSVMACATAYGQERPGAEIYQGVCIICHGTGKHDAPQFGNAVHWQARGARGLDDLIPAAMNGTGRMPRMGANPALSDLELARAVIYMLDAVGHQFGEPTLADLKKWRETAEDRRKRR